MRRPTHDLRTCRAMFEKLSEYIDNELDEVTCQSIEQHARECIRCKTCLDTLQRTIELCRNAPEAPLPEVFSSRLKEFIQNLS